MAQVGAIIGKGGEVISQLKSVIGVKIRISDRDDFVPGTRNRKVTISGAAEAVQIAQVQLSSALSCSPLRLQSWETRQALADTLLYPPDKTSRQQGTSKHLAEARAHEDVRHAIKKG